MKIRSGNIPKELVYIRGREENIVITWDDTELEEGEVAVQEKVFPTFVSDSTNPGTLATGRTWADNSFNRYSYQAGKQVKVAGQRTEIVRKNEPIEKLRIFGLDIRYNGGRAWKCADQDGNYFDLREDVLLDLMRTEGVSPGGYLNGTYIWAKVAAEMKLVRVNSDLHLALGKSTERREMKFISKKELIPNHIYQEKNGETWLYVGKASYLGVDKPDLDMAEKQEAHFRNWLQATEEDARLNPPGVPIIAPPKYSYGNSYVNGRKANYIIENYVKTCGPLSIVPANPPRIDFKYKRVSEHLWFSLGRTWNDSKSREENLAAIGKEDWFKKPTKKNHKYDGYQEYQFQEKFKFGDRKVVNDLGEYKIDGFFEKTRNCGLAFFNYDYSEKNLAGVVHDNRIIMERRRLKTLVKWMQYGTLQLASDPIDDNVVDYWITEIISREPK